MIRWNYQLTKQNWLVCAVGTFLLFNRFLFQNLRSGPKGYRAFRETGPWSVILGGLSNDDDDGKENGKQPIGLIDKTITLLAHHAFFYISISRFVEDVNTRQRLAFSFSELCYSCLEFNSRKKNCQHLTNWMSWNKRDKVWSSANSYFNRLFLSRRRRCCFSSLFYP